MDALTYPAARAYLEALISGPAIQPGLSRQQRLEKMRARVARVRYFLRRLGDPHKRYPIVHVGGTSGKGSTAKLLATILQAAGYRTGLHTTPYLQEPLEELVVDGRCATPEGLAELVQACQPAIEHVQSDCPLGPPGYSETWAALMFAYFARAQVDIAVVEVVAGGRYDFTNPIEPVLSVITTIDFDHMEVLGETLADIAWHKAGIIKTGTPAVTGVSRPELVDILRAECERQAAPLFQVGQATRYELRRLDLGGGWFDFYGLDGTCWHDMHVSMLGAHQVANAATAVTAAQVLQRWGGIEIPEQAVRAGLQRARWPGRLEIVQEHPLVVLDGAHNPEKMAGLRLALQSLFPGQRLILVIGIIAAKDFAGIVSEIVPIADVMITTTAQALGKEAVSPDEIAGFIRAQGFAGQLVCEPQPRQAVERALALAQPADVICVTGSLYLLGQVRAMW